MDIFLSRLLQFAIRVPIALIALPLHELSHALVAYLLGDPTAKQRGRFTLNPLKHLDPIGTTLFVLLGFGWAKPVPVSMMYFKKPKRDMGIVALAGPVSNLLIAFVTLLILVPLSRFLPLYITNFVNTFAILNIGLAIFNLIPINPLDGSRILGMILPNEIYYKLMQYERYIMVGLMVLLFFGAFSGIISGISFAVYQGILRFIFFILRM